MKKNTKQVVVAAGVAAGLAAISAAGYFMLGPQGRKNRKQIKGWTLKMKGDVLERLEKLKDVTPEVYNDIIDDVTTKYSKLKNISADELTDIAEDLKKHWKAISRDMKAAEAKVKVGAKKKTVSVKKAVKKVAKKVKAA